VEPSSSLWSESSTWNGTTIDYTAMTSANVQAQQWFDVWCPGLVQWWADRADSYNKGFLVYEPYTALSYGRKFRSGEYSDGDYRPKLSADYETPTMASQSNAGSYRVGDAAQVTVRPRHPYTRRLFLAAPVADPVKQEQRRAERRRLESMEVSG